MRIFIWRSGFKIRSKKDAEHFLNCHDSSDFGHAEEDIYWCDEKNDYCLYPKYKRVGVRSQRERGNIFSPYLILENPVEVIWKTRKYINWQLFNEDY